MVTGQARHLAEDADEVVALERAGAWRARGSRAVDVAGEDHLAHGGDALLVEEHVLGAAEADALGAEVPRGARVERRVGVGAHAQAPHLVGPPHELAELAAERRGHRRDRAEVDLPGAAVERDDVAAPSR